MHLDVAPCGGTSSRRCILMQPSRLVHELPIKSFSSGYCSSDAHGEDRLESKMQYDSAVFVHDRLAFFQITLYHLSSTAMTGKKLSALR